MTNYYAPLPHDWPPSKVAAPKSLKATDMFPALTIKATRAQVKKFGDVLEQEDELGTCLVAHFEVFGTLIIFYQSALDDKDYWTVFVDMVSCVEKEQFPTKLGNAVVRQLSIDAIRPEWKNDEADTEYRSRRRNRAQVGGVKGKPSIKSVALSGNLSRPTRGKLPLDAANDWTADGVATGRVGRFLTAARAAPAQKFVTKKVAAPAKKAVAAKRAAPAKKAAKKAAPTKR